MSKSIRTILIPTDFSSCADGALSAALSLAEKHGASLHLLHAVVLHGDDPYNPGRYFPDTEALFSRLQQEAQERIAELEAGWKDRPVQVTSEIRQGIHPSPVILEVAAELDAGLVVLGTHGRRGPSRWLLGSVAEEVVRRAPCPVLTVRQQDEIPTLREVRRILVPVDFSDDVEESLAVARDLARRYGARLSLLHLVEPVVVPGPYGTMHSMRPVTLDYELLAQQARSKLEELIEGEPEVPFKAYAFSGMARVDIVGFANQLPADLIVIGSHGRTGVRRFLLGSTAEQVVRTAGCPVLVVKNRQAMEAAESALGLERTEPYPGLELDQDVAEGSV